MNGHLGTPEGAIEEWERQRAPRADEVETSGEKRQPAGSGRPTNTGRTTTRTQQDQ
jgi:hypothetical protein